MSLWETIAKQLVGGQELTYQNSYQIMELIMSGDLGESRLASILSILALRGVSTDELAGMADSMRDCAKPIDLPTNVVDIVGTGGDQASTVNISTMAAVVIAASGTPVVKHGNRASTSASGSADVLEALGVNLLLSPEQIVHVFDQTGIAFLFANQFHPSMRHAASVRRELAFPTAFNVLGPLTNPARPSASAIGVARSDIAPLVAGVFARRGTSATVFRGAVRGLDELTTTEPAEIWIVQDGQIDYQTIDPVSDLSFRPAKLADLRGGNPAENAAVAREVFGGATGPITDAVILNAAAGIIAAENAQGIGDKNRSLVDRFHSATVPVSRTLESGSVLGFLDEWVAASNSV